MIYLIVSILLATLLFVIFKLFSQFNINILQAIVVNYVIACICGLASYSNPFSVNKIIEMPWFTGAFLLGVLLFLYLMSWP